MSTTKHPKLQNLPLDTELGKQIRESLFPKPPLVKYNPTLELKLLELWKRNKND